MLVQRENKGRESAAFLGETVVLYVLQPEAIITDQVFFFSSSFANPQNK